MFKSGLTARDIYAQLSGHAACVCDCAPPLLKRDCQVAIPCKGDRKNARAQDDEILFPIVPDMLTDFMEVFRWLSDHGWSIPIIQEYREEYVLKEIYRNLAEKLGMDLSKLKR